MKPLVPRQATFVREYLTDLNATQAAIRAGYSARTAEAAASRLLRNVNVKEHVDDAKRKRYQRIEVKQDEVLRELLRIMNTDISAAFDETGKLLPLKKIPEDLRRAISSIEINDSGDSVKKLKLHDKLRALELLGKHLKLFTEKHQVEHSFTEMTDEQLEAKKQEIITRGQL